MNLRSNSGVQEQSTVLSCINQTACVIMSSSLALNVWKPWPRIKYKMSFTVQDELSLRELPKNTGNAYFMKGFDSQLGPAGDVIPFSPWGRGLHIRRKVSSQHSGLG